MMKKLLCMILSLVISLTVVSVGVADRSPEEVENIQEGIQSLSAELNNSSKFGSTKIEFYYHPEDDVDPEYIMILVFLYDVSPDYFDLSNKDQFTSLHFSLLMAAFAMYEYIGGYVGPDTVLPNSLVGLFCGESAEFVTSMKDITYNDYLEYRYGGMNNE